ncbi:hypothetical protein AA103196_1264 [Ameyamaea chiangmaiensis NBRC 103196]|uniref:Lipoprotein n=1 Tax=Ameyamaea chiangmaiensis TaxID=442969 RepID=A0A850PAS6_9PROT|nr:hypothetical protein [Ameyamaea chiangmaiensis]MBS4074980.1 hypothetical protein [Ameyamaea chiangmaiensis]NVN41655.1 hypothetical protein [Ameyamaea chiangmaiensis]GBQ65974.1 hypothetical protein AA103196_1264 [Ameyamaea chiangmaiensis NBRC 103196]
MVEGRYGGACAGRALRLGVAAILLALPGCIDMPHPFADPGGAARSLAAHPPPARLSVPVPVPRDASLDAPGAHVWAEDVTHALLDQSVPAIVQDPRPGDWWLRLRTERTGGQVVPVYSVMTPQGTVRGEWRGSRVPEGTWHAATNDMMMLAAQEAAPHVADALTGIQADVMAHDKSSLKNRPARVWFKGVTGAPGDGNAALARSFVAAFRDTRDQVQDTARGADFTVVCVVTLSDGPAGAAHSPMQHIELTWRVTDPQGKEAGAATQLHDIPAHSLDHDWGDVAEAAATEAAGGVQQIIGRYSGRDNTPLPPPGLAIPATAGK